VAEELYDHSEDAVAENNLALDSAFSDALKDMDLKLTEELAKYSILK
jgi:hypothetical protein